MKLAMQGFELIYWFGEEKAFAILKESGFDGVDYYYDHRDHVLKDGYIERAQNTRALLDRAGISCVQVHAPFDFTYEQVEDNYTCLLRAIECAGIIGAPYIVIHYLMPPQEVDFIECNRAFYKSFEPYAKKAGVKIAIENLYYRDLKRGGYLGKEFADPYILKEFVKSLDSDIFVACVDTGHASLTPTEPEDFIRVFDNNTLKVLHVHDTDYLDDRHTLPGIGTLNWNEITKALGEIDYQGNFSFEINKYMSGFQRMDKELMIDAAKLAAKTGRKLIEKIEASRS